MVEIWENRSYTKIFKITPICYNNHIMTMEFLGAYNFLLQIYKNIQAGEDFPFRELKMVSSRFSGKTRQMEQLFVLLFLQSKKRVVMNYVRARGDDAMKAKDTLEALAKKYTNGQAKIVSNEQKKYIKNGINKINFQILNEIKEKVQKNGGKIGVPIEYEADYIITFYEEASQLDKDLVENHRQSVRGSENTKKFFVYASNPWTKSHWLMEEFAKMLPETEQSIKELEEKGYNVYFDEKTETIYYRPRWTLNPFMDPKDIAEIERMKTINYEKWKVVSLGVPGVLNTSLYQQSLKLLNENVNENMEGYLLGGIDWGDGKSASGSPTTAYIGIANTNEGVHILDEYEHKNSRDGALSTEGQLEKICDFFIKWYDKFQKPITCYIDNAALGDFFQMVQSVLTRKGYTAGQIEFLPAYKPKNTFERVETMNVMLSLGILRFNKNTCPALYKALENCYEVIKPNPTEEMKRQRSHEWTHWIHAVEYLIGSLFKEFQAQFPIWVETKSLEAHR